MSPAWVDAAPQGDTLKAQVTSSPGQRSAAQLTAVVTQFDVARSLRYAKGQRGGGTWCNRFVCDVTAAMGAPVPYQKANDMAVWFDRVGAQFDWQAVLPVRAMADASAGRPVVAVWKNPDATKSGHVAIVIPAKGPGIWIAQAGAENFSFGLMRRGFGEHLDTRFWSHP